MDNTLGKYGKGVALGKRNEETKEMV